MIRVSTPQEDFQGNRYDYVFDKVKDWNKIQLWLFPKIDRSNWTIALIDIRIEDLRPIITGIADNIDLDIFAKKDVVDTLRFEYPDKFAVKTGRERYMDLIAGLSKEITHTASKELYSRARGRIDIIKEILDKLDSDNEIKVIGIEHINREIVKSDRVFARDVVLAALLKSNKLIPNKGSYLSKYRQRYTSSAKLFEDLSNAIGQEIAFNACKKFIRNLLKNKLKYLSGEDVKEPMLIKSLDVYQLIYARTLFQRSKPEQWLACLTLLERRKESADFFRCEILTHRA